MSLTGEASRLRAKGELVVDLDWFQTFDDTIAKVEVIIQDVSLHDLYCLKLSKHDHENVLRVIDILKKDNNFDYVEPDYSDDLNGSAAAAEAYAKYNFVANNVCVGLTGEASELREEGKLVFDFDYFKKYDDTIAKVKVIVQNTALHDLYLLKLDRHDHENVLRVIELLKKDPNFEYVEPDYLARKVPCANTMEVSAKAKTVSYKKVKKANQIIAPVTVKNAKGKVSYEKLSGSKKIYLKKSGKIAVLKGAKKGTYTVKIKVTAKGNAQYKAASRKVTVKIKVK